jgi:hypothetical protein
MRVFVTGGTGHSGSYTIPELIAAGHEVTGLTWSDTAAAAVCALGAKVRRGDLQDLEGLMEAAADSDGVIHVAHRQDLLPSGGMDAVAAAELPVMLAYGEALAGTGKPLVAAANISSPGTWAGRLPRRTRRFPPAMSTRAPSTVRTVPAPELGQMRDIPWSFLPAVASPGRLTCLRFRGYRLVLGEHSARLYRVGQLL